MNSGDNPRDYGKYIVYITAISVLILGTNFLLTTYYYIPDLTYETLDAYPLSDNEQIIPIIIRNEGHVKASNIKIIVNAEGDITNVQEKSVDNLINKIDNNTLESDVKRLVSNTQIILYLRINTNSQNPIYKISLISDEGLGNIHEKSYVKSWLPVVIIFLLILIIYINWLNRPKPPKYSVACN